MRAKEGRVDVGARGALEAAAQAAATRAGRSGVPADTVSTS